ncbi:acyl-CoA dehydrogenase [Candidatus Woesearchaeota archaeon]|nr:acyl-CoA dehydrogenase [Candidatus Woesearchaeota archaeon]MBM4076123.1 acyl-CoA dehydrogenase [Planctomycetota bacterium]
MTTSIELVEEPVFMADDLIKRVHTIGKNVLAVHADEVDRMARFPRESIDAMKAEGLLSAYVPQTFGGMGLNLAHTAKLCEVMGRYCGSSAMIYAMHCIQVACVVHHAQSSAWFRDYLRRLVDEQRLMASATTEVGTGGDLRSSVCGLVVSDESFQLTKQAPVISYGEHADDILVTCRRSPEASSSDQLHVLVERQSASMVPLSTWDTMGFRGTCSSGFILTSQGHVDQVLPTPFEEILSQTMHPYSHVVWAALWTGIASDAVNRARAFVRAESRKTPGETPLAAIRLAEVDRVLNELRQTVDGFTREYQQILDENRSASAHGFGFSIRTNNLKLTASTRIVEIVSQALLICGISGYRNDSKFSLSRHLRDAYGAALMVNNDRITKLNATMLLAHKEGV